jgi:hypothetical protein
MFYLGFQSHGRTESRTRNSSRLTDVFYLTLVITNAVRRNKKVGRNGFHLLHRMESDKYPSIQMNYKAVNRVEFFLIQITFIGSSDEVEKNRF